MREREYLCKANRHWVKEDHHNCSRVPPVLDDSYFDFGFELRKWDVSVEASSFAYTLCIIASRHTMGCAWQYQVIQWNDKCRNWNDFLTDERGFYNFMFIFGYNEIWHTSYSCNPLLLSPSEGNTKDRRHDSREECALYLTTIVQGVRLLSFAGLGCY